MRKLILFFVIILLSLSALAQTDTSFIRGVFSGYFINDNKEFELFNVRDYGAIGDGITDDTQSFQDAIDAGGANCKIVIPTGDYKITSTLTIANHRVNIIGDGKYATTIIFAPGVAGDTVLFLWDNQSMIVQCSISQLGISEGDNYTKTAFKIIDADVFNMNNIAVYPWSSTNKDAIVLHTQGRDLHTFSNVDFWGDRPIYIDDNPNSTIDADHYRFENCYLNSISNGIGHPLIEVVSGTNITSLIFDGVQAWVFGAYGFYWVDTETSQISNNLSFSNVRFEQGDNESWCFYINHNTGLKNTTFNNILVSEHQGFFLRNLERVSFNNVSTWASTSSDTALNIDISIGLIDFKTTNFAQGSIVINKGALGVSGGFSRFRPSVNYPYTDNYTIPTVRNLLINPAVNATQPYSQISSPSVTVPNTDSSALCKNSTMGFLFISERGNGYVQAMYLINYNTVTEIHDFNNSFSKTRGTTNSYNIYYNSDEGMFYIENNKTGSAQFTIVFIGIADIYP